MMVLSGAQDVSQIAVHTKEKNEQKNNYDQPRVAVLHFYFLNPDEL